MPVCAGRQVVLFILFWVINLFPRTHFLVVNSNLSESYAFFSLNLVIFLDTILHFVCEIFLAPAVTKGATELSMQSASVRFLPLLSITF